MCFSASRSVEGWDERGNWIEKHIFLSDGFSAILMSLLRERTFQLPRVYIHESYFLMLNHNTVSRLCWDTCRTTKLSEINRTTSSHSPVPGTRVRIPQVAGQWGPLPLSVEKQVQRAECGASLLKGWQRTQDACRTFQSLVTSKRTECLQTVWESFYRLWETS